MQEVNQNNPCNMVECGLSRVLDRLASAFLSLIQDNNELLEILDEYEDIGLANDEVKMEQLPLFRQSSCFLDWSYNNDSWVLDIERTVDLHRTSEAQYGRETLMRPNLFLMKSWSSMLSGSKKRKRELVSDILSDAERDIEAEMVKVCKMKLNKDKMEDMVLTTFLARNMMGMKACHLLQQVTSSIKEIEMQWLVPSNLHCINLHVLRIEGKCKEASLEADETNWSSLKLTELNKSNLKCLRLYSARPWVRTDVLGRLSYLEELLFGLIYLDPPLYDKAKYRMEYKIFQGLEQALKSTAWGKTPDYLKSIANRIEHAQGKATEVFHIPVQVLVCAAIKEMEDLPVENLDWDTLEKWGATLKYAKEFGFRVGFADNLLKTNLLAYLAYSTMVG